jgi:hypothetical protein
MCRSNPNLVIGWDLFVDAKASEGMSTALNWTPCVYGFELQVSKATASTLVTVSWFIPVSGRYWFLLELLDSVMTKKNLIKTWFSLNFLIILFSLATGYIFLLKKFDLFPKKLITVGYPSVVLTNLVMTFFGSKS